MTTLSALHEVADQLRDRGGLLERRHVPGLVDHLDACMGDQRLEFFRVNRRHERILLAPYYQGGRGDPMDPLAQSLVGERPDELAGASEVPRDPDHRIGFFGIHEDELARGMIGIGEEQRIELRLRYYHVVLDRRVVTP